MVAIVYTRCAVVQSNDGLVVNIIIAIPSDTPPEGCELIEIMNGQDCDIGWYWDGANFINPNPPVQEEEAI